MTYFFEVQRVMSNRPLRRRPVPCGSRSVDPVVTAEMLGELVGTFNQSGVPTVLDVEQVAKLIEGGRFASMLHLMQVVSAAVLNDPIMFTREPDPEPEYGF